MKKMMAVMAISAAFAVSACDVDVKDEGKLPSVDINTTEGRMPDVEVTTPEIEVQEKNVTVAVPDVDVKMPADK
jgi:hypothetical protein